MTPPGNLEAFTLTALDLLGGAAEELTAGLYTALWPATGNGQLETRQLAFDPELIDERPDAELVTFGSPALEDLIQRATASARVAQAFLTAPMSPTRTVVDQLSRAYRFRDSVWVAESCHPWWLPGGIFLFRVRYPLPALPRTLVRAGSTRLGNARLRPLPRRRRPGASPRLSRADHDFVARHPKEPGVILDVLQGA
jgi:hypothetical protein